MNEKIPVWIDTDTGVDDAGALMTAFSFPELDVTGISAVAGNVHLKDTFRNARNVAYLCGRQDVKVYPGAEGPLFCELVTAEAVHGDNGIGNVTLPESPAPKETKKAWTAMYEKAKELKGELQIIAVGPLTDLALAITTYPDFHVYVKRILIMGGAAVGGNVTAAAEFNIHADPEAAEIVFNSGIPVVMCGLDVTDKAVYPFEELDRVYETKDPRAVLLHDAYGVARPQYSTWTKGKGIRIHDANPVLYAVHPEIYHSEHCGVFVETQGLYTRGKTVTDLWSDQKFKERHVDVVLDVDVNAFCRYITDAVTK